MAAPGAAHPRARPYAPGDAATYRLVSPPPATPRSTPPSTPTPKPPACGSTAPTTPATAPSSCRRSTATVRCRVAVSTAGRARPWPPGCARRWQPQAGRGQLAELLAGPAGAARSGAAPESTGPPCSTGRYPTWSPGRTPRRAAARAATGLTLRQPTFGIGPLTPAPAGPPWVLRATQKDQGRPSGPDRADQGWAAPGRAQHHPATACAARLTGLAPWPPRPCRTPARETWSRRSAGQSTPSARRPGHEDGQARP